MRWIKRVAFPSLACMNNKWNTTGTIVIETASETNNPMATAIA